MLKWRWTTQNGVEQQRQQQQQQQQQQQHHHQQRQEKHNVQREQQGQQAHKRSQLLAEMQPEPPLLPLLEGTGRRPLVTGGDDVRRYWRVVQCLQFPQQVNLRGFSGRVGQLDGDDFESVDLALPYGRLLTKPGNAPRAALVPRVPRVRDTC